MLRATGGLSTRVFALLILTGGKPPVAPKVFPFMWRTVLSDRKVATIHPSVRLHASTCERCFQSWRSMQLYIERQVCVRLASCN